MLFSERSLSTMVHGIGFGGAALLGLGAALFYLFVARPNSAGDDREPRALAALAVFTAIVLWLAVLAGTYVVFPPYRATPPAGTADLSEFPRAFVLANPGTAWLHAFAMEVKEHMPWIAAMLTTAVAFIAVRYRRTLLADAAMRRLTMVLTMVSFAVVAFVSLLGVFVNKVAPVD